MHGRWTVSPETYAAEAVVWMREIGMLDWAAIQDWMCEPFITEKTGLTVEEHQRRTIESLRTLRQLAPGVPWTPVVQGWEVADYLRHVDMYAAAGFDLMAEPIVGVGSVCRRQGTHEGAEIMRALAATGIKIHAFGIKTQGLAIYGDRISSADSMAWSYVARRRNIRLPGCTHKTCSNCFKFAMQWAGNLRTEPVQAPQTAMPW